MLLLQEEAYSVEECEHCCLCAATHVSLTKILDSCVFTIAALLRAAVAVAGRGVLSGAKGKYNTKLAQHTMFTCLAVIWWHMLLCRCRKRLPQWWSVSTAAVSCAAANVTAAIRKLNSVALNLTEW